MPNDVIRCHMMTYNAAKYRIISRDNLERPMREKKRLSDDMMEFIISQLKFKKADEALLDNFTKATVSHSNPTPLYRYII